jgi:hypothetical protein
MTFKTEQEAFWVGKFGTEYIQRNQGVLCLLLTWTSSQKHCMPHVTSKAATHRCRSLTMASSTDAILTSRRTTSHGSLWKSGANA